MSRGDHLTHCIYHVSLIVLGTILAVYGSFKAATLIGDRLCVVHYNRLSSLSDGIVPTSIRIREPIATTY